MSSAGKSSGRSRRQLVNVERHESVLMSAQSAGQAVQANESSVGRERNTEGTMWVNADMCAKCRVRRDLDRLNG